MECLGYSRYSAHMCAISQLSACVRVPEYVLVCVRVQCMPYRVHMRVCLYACVYVCVNTYTIRMHTNIYVCIHTWYTTALVIYISNKL